MKEKIGNIFEQTADAVCITTNGIVKNDSQAVMGAGIALTARQLEPSLPKKLGTKLSNTGNKVYAIETADKLKSNFKWVVTFPTKNHFKNPSSISLVEKSLSELKDLTDSMNWSSVVLPRPGCGVGKLTWEEVKPICEKYLDDRFTIVDFKR